MDDHSEQSSQPSHDPGTRKGEEMRMGEDEPGRVDTGTTQTGRPTGAATGRFATGINPEAEEPIDPSSPDLPPA